MPSTSGSAEKNAVNMDRRCSNASDTSLDDGAVRKLSLQEGTEFIPTRSSKVTPPKPAANPLQFIKVGPCDLYKSAQEQIKRVEEVKRIKETVKEEAEDWQSNLDNWKCSRRKRQEHIIERVVEVKKLELEEHDRNRRRSKTFNEMMEERNSRGRKTSLMVFKDDEANDLSDLGIGTSSGDDNQSLSDRDERPSNGSHDDNHSLSDRDEQPRNGNLEDTVLESSKEFSEEYTYDRAIQTYVNFTETRVKARNNLNEENKLTETVTNGHKDTSKKTPPQIAAKPKRETVSKVEEKLSFLEERRRSSTDLSSSDKVKLAKVDVLKRRELFEKGDNEVKSPSKVLVNNSQSIKDRLSSLEKQGEVNGVKNVNRMSGEITGSIKDRLTSLEQQKSIEKLNGKEDLLRKRLSNGDLSPPQSVKERLSSLKKQGSTDDCKDNAAVSKIVGEVTIKDRLSNLDSAVNKDVKKTTPNRDPTFSTKRANFQNEEIAFDVALAGGKHLAGSERSSSPDEDEIYATERQQFHRSLDSLDVEGDLGNETFERVQSLEELDCLGRRNYPHSASSTEMLVFSSQSGDTDREDSGIHTADVSSSVSQADEPVEDSDIITTISNIHLDTNSDNFLDIETVSHRRQISELSEQLSPLPPIQEIETFETTTVFLHVDDSPEKTQSDDVSQPTSPSIIIGNGIMQTTSRKTKKDIPFRKLPSPLVLVDIDIDGISTIKPQSISNKPSLNLKSGEIVIEDKIPSPEKIISKIDPEVVPTIAPSKVVKIQSESTVVGLAPTNENEPKIQPTMTANSVAGIESDPNTSEPKISSPLCDIQTSELPLATQRRKLCSDGISKSDITLQKYTIKPISDSTVHTKTDGNKLPSDGNVKTEIALPKGTSKPISDSIIHTKTLGSKPPCDGIIKTEIGLPKDTSKPISDSTVYTKTLGSKPPSDGITKNEIALPKDTSKQISDSTVHTKTLGSKPPSDGIVQTEIRLSHDTSKHISDPTVHTKTLGSKPLPPMFKDGSKSLPQTISPLQQDPKLESLAKMKPLPDAISKPEAFPKAASVPSQNCKPVTVSGVLKLQLSIETLVKDKSPPVTPPDPEVPRNEPVLVCGGGNVVTRPLPVVVSICRKDGLQDEPNLCVDTQVKDSITPAKPVALRSKSSPLGSASVGTVSDAPMSTAEKRRTVVEICERVDVSRVGEARSPPPTPFITVHSGGKGDSIKEPLEAIIASRQPVPDTMMLTARETVTMASKEEASLENSSVPNEMRTFDVCQEVGVERLTSPKMETSDVETHVDSTRCEEKKVDSSPLPISAYNGLFIGKSGEEIFLPMSTSELLPLNMNVDDMELLGGGLAFPLAPPSSVEPPKEKPPPPPMESDEEVPKPKSSLRRIDSTKRIKKELRRKRSDFLGIEGNVDDDSYLEPVLSVAPPDMTAFLIEEQRQEKQLYRQSICSESDSNPGESRDSGVELDRPQVLTPDQSAQHSRQESEIYCNASITSEEDEITKKEREIIEILEKEEQWRYANNPSEEDLGEKLAEKLRQLEQEKLRLEWERAEEENRRMTEESLRREEKMRLRAKEQELRQQENPVNVPTCNGDNGDGSNLVEVIRAERERLQQEQEELISQRENLIMRETQQVHRNVQPWEILPSSAMSLQDISLHSAGYQPSGLPPAVPPAPLNYRLSLPDLQEQAICEQQVARKSHRPPPPIPPSKPLRTVSQEQQERENSIKNSRTPSAELSYTGEGVQLRHAAVSSSHAQQMSRQTLQALSAAPRSRIVSTDTWIQAKKKPESQRNSGQGNNYNYQHWLIQEAEHRRITEQHQRNAAPMSPRKSTPVSPAHPFSPQWTQPQQREKPLPDAIIQTLTQRVQNRAGFNENKTSPPRRETQSQMSQKSMQISPLSSVPNSNMKNGPSINNGTAIHNGPNIHNSPTMHSGPMMNNGPLNHSPVSTPTTNGDSQEKMLSVSGKKKCSHCGEELGRGAAMIIESLRLFYHIDCFKCCVCHVQLGDGLMGTDVRVRNNKLHCHNCYSSDDGVKFSCV